MQITIKPTKEVLDALVDGVERELRGHGLLPLDGVTVESDINDSSRVNITARLARSVVDYSTLKTIQLVYEPNHIFVDCEKREVCIRGVSFTNLNIEWKFGGAE